jgi:hemerythrin-like domain-containing protein
MTTVEPHVHRAVHDALRRSNDLLVRAIGGVPPGDADRIEALARWFDGYRQVIHRHHDAEDRWLFPALRERTAAFAEFERGLARDHARLDELVAGLAVTLSRWASSRSVGAADAGELQAHALDLAVELDDLMAAHLDVEDRQVLPLVEDDPALASGPGAGDARATRGEARFGVPWLLANADADTGRRVLASTPRHVRVTRRWHTVRYDRLAQAAFGPSDVNPARRAGG